MHWRGKRVGDRRHAREVARGVGRLRKFQRISSAPGLVVRLRGTMGLGGGSHLTRSLLSTSDHGHLTGRAYGRAYAGQLRRRGPKPSAAYGGSTSGRPANRTGEGARVGSRPVTGPLYPLHSMPSDPPRGPEVVHLAFGGRTQTGPQCPETVRKSSAHWTRGGRFPDIEVHFMSTRRRQCGQEVDLVEGRAAGCAEDRGCDLINSNELAPINHRSGSGPQTVRLLDARRTVSGP